MSASLLDSLSKMVTPDLLSQAASALGENEGGLTRGIGAALPMLLGGVTTRASDPGFASTLFKLVSDSGNDLGAIGNIASLLSPGAANSPMMALGSKLLSSLFGNNLNAVGSSVASYAGVRPQSASSLLSMAAPMVLSVLGKQVKDGGLNASSLASLLAGQKGSIAAALPSGMHLDRYLAAPVMAAAPEPAKASIWRWLLPVLLVLGALLLLSRCMKKEEPVQATPEVAPQAEVLPAPVEAAPAVLPQAVLFFDTGATALPADSGTALAPVIAYLGANPTAMAVVSGFNDPTGDPVANEELAKSRAIAVRDALVAGGIADTRIELLKPADTTGEGSLEAARRVEVTVR
jgi:hypothetical protein